MRKAAVIDDKKAIFNRWVIKNYSWDFCFFCDINNFLLDSSQILSYDAIIADCDLGYTQTSLELGFGKALRKRGYKNKLILSTVHSFDAIKYFSDLKYYDGVHKKLSLEFCLDKVLSQFK